MGSTVLITAVLVLGAGAVVPWAAMALQYDDIEAVESPLLLAVARQWGRGAGVLYGPYGGRDPLVLIHAPLYYRLAALAGWPLHRAGFGPVPSALAAGRGLSAIGLLATLVAAYRLARLGDPTGWAGWWAALLVAATPLCGGVPFEVRPDMLGIALQTTGILLVLSALAAFPINEPRLTAAFGCFAVAACIKQHFVVAPLVSLLLLGQARARGRLGVAPIFRCVSIALAIIVLYYGTEEWITAGRMSQSIVIAAGQVGRVHPADWFAALNLLLASIWKCVGLILLLGAAGLAMVAGRPGPGRGRTAFVAAGTILVGTVTALAVLQFFQADQRVAVMIVLGLIVVIAVVVPVCARLERTFIGGGLDRALWAYGFAEMAFTLILWRLSTGGWYNYALQAGIIAGIATGRALSRAAGGAGAWRPWVPAVLAALAVPAFAATDVRQVLARREFEKAGLARALEIVRRPSAELFFVDLPGVNRVHGRIDLVYDPWLYPVFESAGLAEPRSIWLEKALTRGAVRVVVTTSTRTRIDGLNRSLPDLGYHLTARAGPYLVWARQPAAEDETRRTTSTWIGQK